MRAERRLIAAFVIVTASTGCPTSPPYIHADGTHHMEMVTTSSQYCQVELHATSVRCEGQWFVAGMHAPWSWFGGAPRTANLYGLACGDSAVICDRDIRCMCPASPAPPPP